VFGFRLRQGRPAEPSLNGNASLICHGISFAAIIVAMGGACRHHHNCANSPRGALMKKPSVFLYFVILALILIPAHAEANSGDFSGGVAIGTSYAGTNTAPTNGLIIQGKAGIGTSSPSHDLDVFDGTANGLGLSGASTGNTPSIGATGTDTNISISISPKGAGGAMVLGIQPTPGGRVTPTSGTPVLKTEAFPVITIYYAPYVSPYIPLYDGTSTKMYQFTSSPTDTVGLSLALDDNNAHTGYQTVDSIFDLFVYNNSGTLALCSGPAWTNSTTRSAAISLYNGIWTNSSSLTLKCDATSSTSTCAANQCTYVGSIYTLSGTTTLNGAINNSVTSITVASACGTDTYCFPPSSGTKFYIKIDSEVMLVTGGNATTTWTVTRGQRGTSAASHSNSATVSMDAGQTQVTTVPGVALGGNMPILGVYNAYNNIGVLALERDTTQGWTYNSTSERECHGTTTNSVLYLDGLQQGYVKAHVQNTAANSTVGDGVDIGVYINTSTATDPKTNSMMTSPTGTLADNYQTLSADAFFNEDTQETLGLNSINCVEYVLIGGTATFQPSLSTSKPAYGLIVEVLD
jgi:hypothetical protein